MPPKRFKFQCWNCSKVYFQSLDITQQQEIIFSCPYCRAESVVNLGPYQKKDKAVPDSHQVDEVTTDVPIVTHMRLEGDPTTDAPSPEGKKKKKRKGK